MEHSDLFSWILPAVSGLECANLNDEVSNEAFTFAAAASRILRRRMSLASSISSEQYIQSYPQTLLEEDEEDIGDLSDDSLVILERRDVLHEYGITLRATRPRYTRAPPPNTPIEVHAVSGGSDFMESQKDLPTFIKNISSYPTSHIFAACFFKELQDANEKFLDVNGDITVSDENVTADLNAIQFRMDLLNDSIAYLESVVPPGR